MQTEQEQKAEIIFKHIVETRNNLIGVDPIEDLSQEQLASLVNEEFDRYGLNYIIVGNFNDVGVSKFPFDLKTNEPLHSIADVEKL